MTQPQQEMDPQEQQRREQQEMDRIIDMTITEPIFMFCTTEFVQWNELYLKKQVEGMKASLREANIRLPKERLKAETQVLREVEYFYIAYATKNTIDHKNYAYAFAMKKFVRNRINPNIVHPMTPISQPLPDFDSVDTVLGEFLGMWKTHRRFSVRFGYESTKLRDFAQDTRDFQAVRFEMLGITEGEFYPEYLRQMAAKESFNNVIGGDSGYVRPIGPVLPPEKTN